MVMTLEQVMLQTTEVNVGAGIGEVLRACRERRELSQLDAALALNVSRNTYRLWEIGAQVPNLTQIPTLASWCGMSITQWLLAIGLGPIDEGDTCPTCGGSGRLHGTIS